MPEPYENVYIGNFIFSLGYLHCKRGNALSRISVNLFQQTPADTTYGDLLAGINGHYILIEFKRNEKLVKKEFEKKYHEKFVEKLNENKQLRDTSNIVHFIGYGVNEEESNIIFLFTAVQNKLLSEAITC